jgi:acyl-CoA reductase-like NAD-dependent aldehyde dehydrogenase|tara:strand:- start:599 stop:1300 length:702 start_codon:yes stop_codon:yes gene_type:complete
MEHGGVASVIIDKDVNLKNILPSLIRGSFYHAGQVCVSIQKLIVHEDIIEDFLNSLKHLIGKIKVGDPSNINTDVGPLIRPGEIKRVDRIIKEAIQEGAELICGGEPKTKTTYKCTVLRNPKKSSAVSQKEIFGPVVSVYSYNEINNAIDIANHDKYAFQSSVYTSNIDTAMHCYEKLEAKAVFINEQTAFRVDWMPFGGIKSSGEGVGGIEYTFSDLFYDKLLIINSKKITK